VNGELQRLLEASDGIVSRAAALAAAPHHALDHAVRSRQLVRLFPGIYVDSERMTEPRLRARAALRYAGPAAALSHITALGVWRLPGGALDGPVHVLLPATRRLRGGAGLCCTGGAVSMWKVQGWSSAPDCPPVEWSQA
jgi:hypothetical protein